MKLPVPQIVPQPFLGYDLIEVLAPEREGIEPSEILYFTVVMSF